MEEQLFPKGDPAPADYFVGSALVKGLVATQKGIVDWMEKVTDEEYKG